MKLNEIKNVDNSLILKEFREREPLVTGDETQMLAPHKMKQLQVLIRKGAKDLDQDWVSAVHLVNKAFKVSGHRIPTADMTDGFDQYQFLIGFTVGVLGNIRGPNAKWRLTDMKTFDPENEAIEKVLKQMPGYENIEDIPGYKEGAADS